MNTLLNRVCTLCETETWLEGGFVQCDCLTVPEYEWSMGVIETPKQWDDDIDALMYYRQNRKESVMNDKKQTFKIITEAGDTQITFRFIEMECIGDSWVISAVYESEMPVNSTRSTKFYYCQSKWEHAVIEAHNSPEAKEEFIRIINAQLEENKRLSVKDVDCCAVNVYRKNYEK